eukprot:snap_masked-scaffold_4-processed-gene-3.30-mRNA-1 protein AED:0.47 eAED:0.50 QI:0/-1/0/1/-1/1/1/0/1146
MASEEKELAKYLPRVVLEQLKNGEVRKKTFQCVSIFADISGFTQLTEVLGKLGDTENDKKGTEEIANQINKYWSKIVPVFSESGADIIKFAGDALIAIYRVEDRMLDAMRDELTKNNRGRSDEQALGSVLRCLSRIAVKTCINLQKNEATRSHKFLPNFEISTETNNMHEKVELMIKYGLGSGVVTLQHLGGVSDGLMLSGKKEYLLVGEALRQSFEAESICTGGETAVCETVLNLATTFKRASKSFGAGVFARKGKRKAALEFNVEPNRTDSHCLRYYKVRSPKFGPDESHPMFKRWMDSGLDQVTIVPYVAQKSIWQYLPTVLKPCIGSTLQSSVVPSIWLNSTRQVTTLFCDLGLTTQVRNRLFNGQQESLNALNELFKLVQELACLHEGVINKFCMDDKGYTLLIIFGLPPFTNQDISRRGAECSINIDETLKKFNLANWRLKPRIGVSTGTVFCGLTGATLEPKGRIEYSVIGGKVNFSAKIMSKIYEKKLALKEICLDEETARAISPFKVAYKFHRKKFSTNIKGVGKVRLFVYDKTFYLILRKLKRGEMLCIVSGYQGRNRESVVTKSYASKISATVHSVVHEFFPSAGSPRLGHKVIYKYRSPPPISLVPGMPVNPDDRLNSFEPNAHFPVLWFTVMDAKIATTVKTQSSDIVLSGDSWVKHTHQWNMEDIRTLPTSTRYTHTDVRVTNYGNKINQVGEDEPLCLYQFRQKLDNLFGDKVHNGKNVLYVSGEAGVSFDVILKSVLKQYPQVPVFRVNPDFGLKAMERGNLLWKKIISWLSQVESKHQNGTTAGDPVLHNNTLRGPSPFQLVGQRSCNESSDDTFTQSAEMEEEFGLLLPKLSHCVVVIQDAEALSTFSFMFLNNCVSKIQGSSLKLVILVTALPGLRTTAYRSRGTSTESFEEDNMSHRRRLNSCSNVTKEDLSDLEFQFQQNNNVECGVLIEYPEYTRQIIMDLIHARSIPNDVSEFVEKVTGGSPYKIQQLLFVLSEKKIIQLVRALKPRKGEKSLVHMELRILDNKKFENYKKNFEIPRSCELMYCAVAGSFGAFAEVLMRVASLLRSFKKDDLFGIVYPGQKLGSEQNWKNLVKYGVFKRKRGNFIMPDKWLKVTLRRTVLQGQKNYVRERLNSMGKPFLYEEY